MTYYYSPIAIQVWCEDCEWKTESYKNGQALAAKHAKKYEHKTAGELVIAFGYNYHASPSACARAQRPEGSKP